MNSDWLQDDIGNIYLMNITKLYHRPEKRQYITTEGYYQKLQEQADKKLTLSASLEKKFKNYSDTPKIQKV